jgi:hypothetical protein
VASVPDSFLMKVVVMGQSSVDGHSRRAIGERRIVARGMVPDTVLSFVGNAKRTTFRDSSEFGKSTGIA